jgi:hypothetical protein
MVENEFSSFDWIPPKGGLVAALKPIDWYRKPCVSLMKNGMTLNAVACEIFSFKVGDKVLVSVHNGKILIKAPSNEAEDEVAHVLRPHSGRPAKTRVKREVKPSYHFGHESLVKALVSRGIVIGDYEIKYNPQLRVMESVALLNGDRIHANSPEARNAGK